MSDLRAALESAVDTHEPKEEVTADTSKSPVAEQLPVAEPQLLNAGDKPAEQSDEREPTTGKPAAKLAAESKPGEKAEGEKQVSETGQEPKKPSPVKAPVSWRPEVREKWSALTPEVQHEVLRREREVSDVLRQSADARKFMDGFKELVNPYQQFFAAENSTPMQGFQHYLQTSALLRIGAPAQKASAIADIIKNFGVDLQMLDSELAKRYGGGGTSSATPQVDPAYQQLQQQFAPVIDYVNQLRQREQQVLQQTDQKLTQSLEEFMADEKNEFVNDVREEMADILEIAARRGQSMSLQDAYSRAIMLHPTISKVVEQRRLATSLSQQSQAAQRARNAAVSVPSSGAPSHQGNSRASGNLRSDLESAFDALENGRT
jgi:hypothetical protein